MARVPNRGKASSTKEIDLGFLDDVYVTHPNRREEVYDYIRRHPSTVKPLQWLKEVWGDEMMLDWYGEFDVRITRPLVVERKSFATKNSSPPPVARAEILERFPKVNRYMRVFA